MGYWVTGTHAFNYVLTIQNREFDITITRNRTSYWEDLTSQSLADRLHNRVAQAVISVRASEEIFLKALAMARKEQLEEARTGKFQEPVGEAAEDIAEMDGLLEAFFWQEVNPRLKHPLHPRP
jgi:hypothetical protein